MIRRIQYNEMIDGKMIKRVGFLFKEEEELRCKLLPLYINHIREDKKYTPCPFPYFSVIIYSLLLTIATILMCCIH